MLFSYKQTNKQTQNITVKPSEAYPLENINELITGI